MNKKKISFILCILALILINIYIILMVRPNIDTLTAKLNIEFMADKNLSVQFFYSDCDLFDGTRTSVYEYAGNGELIRTAIDIPMNTEYFRIDFGDDSSNVVISSISLNGLLKTEELENLLKQEFIYSNSVVMAEYRNEVLVIETTEDDPYIVYKFNNGEVADFCLKNGKLVYGLIAGILCLIVDVVGFICLRHFSGLIQVAQCVVENREMIWELTKNDFQAKFAGSFLGVFWAFVQPVIVTLLYWFVFQVGLRAGDVTDYPFVLFLMCGLIPWFYFSETFSGGSNVLIEYNYLVKKVVFDVKILPVIKIFSSLFVHLFFVLVIFVISWIYGYGPSLYTLQLIYYVFGAVVLISGICYLVSAITVFFRDMSQIVNILLTIGVWITPIMWITDSLPRVLRILFMANPIYYLVEGYRDCFLYHEWFWNKPIWTVYFWLVCMVMYCAGMRFFNKSQTHFADML